MLVLVDWLAFNLGGLNAKEAHPGPWVRESVHPSVPTKGRFKGVLCHMIHPRRSKTPRRWVPLEHIAHMTNHGE